MKFSLTVYVFETKESVVQEVALVEDSGTESDDETEKDCGEKSG